MDAAELRDEYQRYFQAHRAEVYRYVLRRAGSNDAEDLTAETFAIAWRRWVEAQQGGLPWLYKTASYVLSNHNRAARRASRLFLQLAEDAAVSQLHAPSVDEQAGSRALLISVLETLRPRDKELLSLLYWEELSPREAATVLGCSSAAVSVRLHRLRARLKKQLDIN